MGLKSSFSSFVEGLRGMVDKNESTRMLDNYYN